MSFFHKKNVTKCLGHHYAIWTKIFFSGQLKLTLISGTAEALKILDHLSENTKVCGT